MSKTSIKRLIDYNYSYNAIDYKYYCNECNFNASKIGVINAHMISHSTYRPFACNKADCGQTFKRKADLDQHLRSWHFNQKPFNCYICRKSFKHWISLKNHMYLHSDKVFVCDLNGCQEVFKTPFSLSSHQKKRHLNNDQNLSLNSPKFSLINDKDMNIRECNEIIVSDSDENEVKVWFPFKCHFKDCSERFLTIDVLRDHLVCHKTREEMNSRVVYENPIEKTIKELKTESNEFIAGINDCQSQDFVFESFESKEF